jgi:hypothetical protein
MRTLRAGKSGVHLRATSLLSTRAVMASLAFALPHSVLSQTEAATVAGDKHHCGIESHDATLKHDRSDPRNRETTAHVQMQFRCDGAFPRRIWVTLRVREVGTGVHGERLDVQKTIRNEARLNADGIAEWTWILSNYDSVDWDLNGSDDFMGVSDFLIISAVIDDEVL